VCRSPHPAPPRRGQMSPTPTLLVLDPGVVPMNQRSLKFLPPANRRSCGIRWLSVPPGNGFGNASEAYLTGLRSAGVPVTWTPLGWPSPVWRAPHAPVPVASLDETTHRDIAELPLAHDTVLVSAPSLWNDRLIAEPEGRLMAAYATWETDRLPVTTAFSERDITRHLLEALS